MYVVNAQQVHRMVHALRLRLQHKSDAMIYFF